MIGVSNTSYLQSFCNHAHKTMSAFRALGYKTKVNPAVCAVSGQEQDFKAGLCCLGSSMHVLHAPMCKVRHRIQALENLDM